MIFFVPHLKRGLREQSSRRVARHGRLLASLSLIDIMLSNVWIVREVYELEEKLGFEKEGLWLGISKLNQSEKKIQTEKLIKFEN